MDIFLLPMKKFLQVSKFLDVTMTFLGNFLPDTFTHQEFTD